jgi:hypothetical protein
MTRVMMHIMTYITTRVMTLHHDARHDAEHVWTLKSEFRSKKSRNFFLTRYGQDSHAPFKSNYKAKQAA